MNVLLLDADGVILEKGEYLSERLAREYDIPLNDVMEFFKGPFVACQAGMKDLKEELVPFLEKWGWEGTVDSFLEYWFEDIVINEDMLSEITKLRNRGVKCYMASNNERYRANRIKDKLDDVLDGYFFSADLKVRKNDPEYFRKVSEQLGVPVSDMHFIDNDEVNIEAAQEAGLEAELFKAGILQELSLDGGASEFKIR